MMSSCVQKRPVTSEVERRQSRVGEAPKTSSGLMLSGSTADSYFGGTNFIGQEVLWLRRTPYWAMNYYGFIIRPDLIDGERAGSTIKAALSRMYRGGRFLGGFEWTGECGTYIDRSEGDPRHFHGREVIMVGGEEAYALHYCGGLIIP